MRPAKGDIVSNVRNSCLFNEDEWLCVVDTASVPCLFGNGHHLILLVQKGTRDEWVDYEPTIKIEERGSQGNS